MSGVLSGLIGAFAPVASSFESIATFTGNGTASSYTFSSIPSTYKSLQIRLFIADVAPGGGGADIRLNSDSGANYTDHEVRGSGTAASAVGYTGLTSGYVAYTSSSSSYYGVSIIDIIDYASTFKYKTIRSIYGIDSNGAAEQTIRLGSNLWLSTSAVNSITIFNSSNIKYATGTTIALYGVK